MHNDKDLPDLQLRPALGMLDFVDTRSNAFQTNFNNITVLKPKWRLPPRANALGPTTDQ